MLSLTRNTERTLFSVSVEDVLSQNWMFLWGNKIDIKSSVIFQRVNQQSAPRITVPGD